MCRGREPSARLSAAERRAGRTLRDLPQRGLAAGVYALDGIAEEAGQTPAPSSSIGTTLAMNVESRELVDEALDEAVRAGGRLLQPAQERFWGGYSGYFADPDDHAWEVAHNPFWPIGEDGLPELP